MNKGIHGTRNIYTLQKNKNRQPGKRILPSCSAGRETLKRSGSEYEWKDGSAKVTVRGNLWFHQYDHEGGDAIDFVRRFYDKSYPEAMGFCWAAAEGSSLSPPVQKKKTVCIAPPKNNMRRTFAYLNITRKIDKDVLRSLPTEDDL